MRICSVSSAAAAARAVSFAVAGDELALTRPDQSERPPGLPLAEVLEYRQKHDVALREARDKLGWIARCIETERSLCILEQLVGALFISILIARLAGVYPPRR